MRTKEARTEKRDDRNICLKEAEHRVLTLMRNLQWILIVHHHLKGILMIMIYSQILQHLRFTVAAIGRTYARDFFLYRPTK